MTSACGSEFSIRHQEVHTTHMRPVAAESDDQDEQVVLDPLHVTAVAAGESDDEDEQVVHVTAVAAESQDEHAVAVESDGQVEPDRSSKRKRGSAKQAQAQQAPLTAEQALQQADAEGLVLVRSLRSTGFTHVYEQRKRFKAEVRRDGKSAGLGTYDTAEEAALVAARHASVHSKGVNVISPSVFLTAEEAVQRADAEGLILEVATNNPSGFAGVCVAPPGSRSAKRYRAWLPTALSKDRHCEYLGTFATAEEAALVYARNKEKQRQTKTRG